MCTAPESWNAAFVSGLSLALAGDQGLDERRGLVEAESAAVYDRGQGFKSPLRRPPCGAGGAMATSAVNPHSMPAQKNMAWHMRSLSPLPAIQDGEHCGGQAAQRRRQMGRNSPGGRYAANATPAENGIEIATISFPSSISIRFLRK